MEARKLFWSGQYDEAEKKFTVYILAHPRNDTCKSFLQMIAQARKHDKAKIELTRKRLESITIDKLPLKEADWRAVSLYLQDLANPKTEGKDSKDYINFISMLPSESSFKVTVDLRKVTLMRAIELICRQAGLRYVVDTWAVIVDLPEARK